MKVLGVDDNGDELLEISAVELDRLCTEVRDKAISDFAEVLKLECKDELCNMIGPYKIMRCASAMRSERGTE